MSVDVDQPGLDFRDSVRVARDVGFLQQSIALEVGLQYDVDQAFRPIGCLLRETADAPARWDRDGSALGRQFAADRFEQGRFAGAIPPDQANPRAWYDLRGAVINQKALEANLTNEGGVALCAKIASHRAGDVMQTS